MTGDKPKKDLGRKEYEYLCDIDEAIAEIETHPRFPEGKSSWDQDKYYRGWCYLQLARIGEAANYLCKPEFGDYERKDTTIPWKNIRGMRTILVHIYWGIDDEIGWSAVEKLPELKDKVKVWIKEKDRSVQREPDTTRSKLKELLDKTSKPKCRDKDDDRTR